VTKISSGFAENQVILCRAMILPETPEILRGGSAMISPETLEILRRGKDDLDTGDGLLTGK
jgi:hypothetical protein